MTDAQLQTQLTAQLQAPWPATAEAIAAHGKAIIATIEQANPSDAWVDEALSEMSHKSWWSLWLCANPDPDRIDVAHQLRDHMLKRRAHLYADEDLITHLLSDPESPVPLPNVAVVLLKTSVYGENRPWHTQPTQDLLGFVGRMAQSPHIIEEGKQKGIAVVWEDLLLERNTADTPDLQQAMRVLWEMQPRAQTEPRVWVDMLFSLGHTPDMMDGFLGYADNPEYRAAALRSMAVMMSQSAPIDVAIMERLFEGIGTKPASDMLCTIIMISPAPHAWLSAVVEILWDRSGMNDVKTRYGTTSYVFVMNGLAEKGMTAEFTKRLSSGLGLQPMEQRQLAINLADEIHAHTPAALCALLNHIDSNDRSAIMEAFFRQAVHLGEDNNNKPLFHAAMTQAWDLLPPTATQTLLDKLPQLARVPHLGALVQKQVLTDSVNRSEQSARPMKM